MLLLFKDDKIYKYKGPEDGEYTVEGLLNFLSADNYLEQSTVHIEDSQKFIETNLGRSSNKMYEKFETYLTEQSKALFKKIKLFHWSNNAKVFLTLCVFIAPVCFIVVASIATIIAYIYNSITKHFYDRKMA